METYLTIEKLAPYLPYGLKFKDIPNGFKGIRELTINNINWCLYDGKPILRPLSDLTKEIEVNGEMFVPIIELAKIAYPKDIKFELINDYVNLGMQYSFHWFIEKDVINFDCRKYFDYKKTYWEHNCYVPNQIKLFEKLFESHFDVFGLIPAGLAININTL